MDYEVGLDTKLISKHFVEASIDDDVASDDQVITNALNTCSKDIDEACAILNFGLKENMVLNLDIEERIKKPQLYDRASHL